MKRKHDKIKEKGPIKFYFTIMFNPKFNLHLSLNFQNLEYEEGVKSPITVFDLIESEEKGL